VSALTEARLRVILAWVVIVLVGGPVAGAVLLGVLGGDSPCILCWAQRTSMVLIALVGLFVVRYGPRPRYVGMAVLLGVFGQYMAIRHAGLHLARDIGQGFSGAILGAHTYSWSWFVHVMVLVVLGVLLLFLRQVAPEEGTREPGRAGRFAFGLFVVVVGANAVQAFVSTGPPPFMGQSDPVRLSLNPKHWVWSMEELTTPAPISLRGSWTVPDPEAAAAAADPDPAHGPLAALPILAVAGWERLGVPLHGALSDLARDSASGRFLAVTDRYGVYLLDSILGRVLRHVVVDPGFSIDLTPFAGAAFLGGDTLAVLATNKSWVLLRPDSAADAGAEWRHFLETDGRVTELGLGRFATVRARLQYVLSLAFDPAAQELITVSVPSARQRRLVVDRFARTSMALAAEFVPRLGAGLALGGDARSLAEYVVTGAAVADGRLYAISAAYSTLLVIDLGERVVRAAYVVPGLDRPVGLAVRGPELLVAQADGRIAVLPRPAP
jgi:Disulfide bond formation protein DsbB